MLDRETALAAVKANIKNDNLVKHMLATEAIMRALACKFGEDESVWGLAGLLHDIDLESVDGDMTAHGKVGSEMAREIGASPEMEQAILCHNEMQGVACESLLDKSLFCVDPLTGLITTAALIRPDKKLSGIQVKSLKKRFKEKRFAASVSREQVASCDRIGLELSEFMEIGITAMQGISDDLGL